MVRDRRRQRASTASDRYRRSRRSWWVLPTSMPHPNSPLNATQARQPLRCATYHSSRNPGFPAAVDHPYSAQANRTVVAGAIAHPLPSGHEATPRPSITSAKRIRTRCRASRVTRDAGPNMQVMRCAHQTGTHSQATATRSAERSNCRTRSVRVFLLACAARSVAHHYRRVAAARRVCGADRARAQAVCRYRSPPFGREQDHVISRGVRAECSPARDASNHRRVGPQSWGVSC